MKLAKIKSLVAAVVSLVSVAALAEEAQTAVQLWEGGPYWATVNVGTSEVQDHPEYGALYKFDDAGAAVKSLLGEEWRVPSKDDFDKLVDTSYCTKTWDSTKKGYTFTGATDGYKDKSIFLPAAGYDYGQGQGRKLAKDYGRYWSSEAYDYNNARYLDFNEGRVNVNSGGRSLGLSVRAVRDTPPSEMVETEIGKDGPKTFCLGPMEGSEGNPWNIGTDGKTPP